MCYRQSEVEHLRSLCGELLSMEGVSQRWTDSVLSLATQVVNLVKPAVRECNDDMDIRQYVQVKKVSTKHYNE